MGSMIEVNAKEIEQLAQKLNAYALTDAQSEKLLDSLGTEIAEQTKGRFDGTEDPEGRQWQELTEAYAKRKRKGVRHRDGTRESGSRGGILVRRRFMSNIIVQVNGGASVLVGSAKEYADYHQNAKKKNRLRRFLGLNNNNIADLGAAAVTAVLAVPGMINELGEIAKNEEMTKEEKSTARGGAIGETVGSIGGAAAGALAGAAFGSILPGAGTVIGALAGAIIGQFGGPLGRLIGEKIGAAAGKEAENKAPEMPPSYAAASGIPYSQLPPEITGYNPYAPGQQAMRFDGSVGLQTDLYIHQDGTFTATQKTRNDTECPFEVGNARIARGYN